MDPDVWYASAKVQATMDVLMGVDSCYAATVFCDDAILTMLSGSKGRFFSRSDDMRLVLDSTGKSIGRSHNHGFNLGSRHFMHNDRYFAVGGRGFWNRHSKLVEFVPSTGEWELQPCIGAPAHLMSSETFYDASGSRVIGLDPEDVLTEAAGKCRLVHVLDLHDFEWSELGMFNPILDVYFKDKRSLGVDLESYFMWVGLHKAVILRKSDLKVVVTQAFNRAMIEAQREVLGDAGDILCVTALDGRYRQSRRQLDGSDEQWVIDWDVEAAFIAGEESALPFVVPHEGHDHEADSPGEKGGVDSWWLILLFSGLAFAAGRLWSLRNPKKVEPLHGGEGTISERPIENAGLSPLVLKFLEYNHDILDTDSLNRLLGLENEQSQETKRARRAQAIRLVNQEYRMRYGTDLIERVRDEQDRRRTVYLIKRHSGSA